MNKEARSLSVAEYYEVIQKEYLMSEFRKKIYFNPKDKAYYTKVMGHKKIKIADIAQRNNLESIFTNDFKMQEVHNELFDEFGKPKFEMSEKDWFNYYTIGNEFSFMGNIWLLDAIKSDGTMIIYCPKLEKYEEVQREEISRIL